MPSTHDIIIIGAGAAGLMCGAVAGARGKSVLIIDHAQKPGEKIRISGGGRCNFTNIHCGPDNFISQNSHFAKSALSRYSPYDFIDMVERYGIKYGNEIRLSTEVLGIEKFDAGFVVTTNHQSVNADKVVIACGGPSIPKMGASRFGYEIAEQFGLKMVKPEPALVPLTFTDGLKTPLKTLAGVSTDSRVNHPDASFDEARRA